MKVLLVEEYATRERLSLLFLRRALERRGHQVRITNIWQLQADFAAERPDVVVDNISDSVAHYVGKLGMLRDSHRNVNLIWEQILCPWNVPRYRFEPAMGDRFVDARVSWGPLFRRLLLAENPGIDPDRVSVTGSPTHAVCRAYRSVPKQEIRALLQDHPFDRYERTVVLAESFGAADLDLERLRVGQTDSRSPFVYEWALYSRAMVKHFSDVAVRLAAKYPNFLFILRVHPGKRLGYYKSFDPLLALPNVRMDGRGNIGPLLRAADLLIAGKSGTLADAYFVGTPSLQLVEDTLPFDRTNILAVAVERFARAASRDEILERDLSDFMTPVADAPELRSLAADWFGDTTPAVFERVVDVIEQAWAMPSVPKTLPLHAYRSGRVLRRLARNVTKRHGIAVRPAPADAYPYDAVYDHLVDALDDGGFASEEGEPSRAMRRA